MSKLCVSTGKYVKRDVWMGMYQFAKFTGDEQFDERLGLMELTTCEVQFPQRKKKVVKYNKCE
jgi:hypothetical protein